MTADFASRYTNANITPNAAEYDSSLFVALHTRLANALSSESLAAAIMAAVLCAHCRGDVVVNLFQDVTKDKAGEHTQATFIAIREALTIAVPFVGLPNCMPACFGLVNDLEQRGIKEVQGPTRIKLRDFDYTTRGVETTTALYRGVNNSEVRSMVQQYFPEMSYFGRTTIWGYLVGSSPIFELRESELIVAASIAAIGATRQACSHIKCAIQIGNRVDQVTVLIDTVGSIASWNGKLVSENLNIPLLADELETNLAPLN